MRNPFYIGIVAFALLFAGCGSGAQIERTDTTQTDSVPVVDSLPDFGVIHTKILSQLPEKEYSTWIYVDSVNAGLISVSHLNAAVLFPSGFGLPDDVDLFAFAKQTIDSSSHLVWYKMQLQGSDNSDLWLVLYDSIGPTEAHLIATKGVGYGYAKFNSRYGWSEVVVDKQEAITVTMRRVQIRKGKFVKSDESFEKFGPGANAEAESKAKIDEFLK